MKIHSKARTTPFQRTRIVEKVRDGSWTIRAATEANGVSRRTVQKWRARAEREPGPLNDRSSRPHLYAARAGICTPCRALIPRNNNPRAHAMG